MQVGVGALAGSWSAWAFREGSKGLALGIPVGLLTLQILDHQRVIQMPWNEEVSRSVKHEGHVVKRVAKTILDFGVKNLWITGGFLLGAAGYEYYYLNLDKDNVTDENTSELVTAGKEAVEGVKNFEQEMQLKFAKGSPMF